MAEKTATQIAADWESCMFESTESDLPGHWHFCGDVNLEYGGTFYNLDPQDLQYGYCDAIRVTDLDSGCGFRGAVLIERLVILGLDDSGRIQQGLDCCGWIPENLEELDPAGQVGMIVDGLLAYGFYDPANCFPDHHLEVLQLESDGEMTFDGWTADRKQTKGDLRGYVIARYLD